MSSGIKDTNSNYSDHFKCLISNLNLMASVTWSVVALLVIVDGINVVVGCDYGTSLSCPGKSCLDIYQKNSKSHGVSKQYIIKVGSLYRFVYCDMKLECGGEKGWMRIANINAGGGDTCPSGWKKITSPTKACRATSDNVGCYSAHFTTHNIPYSRVCGMVVGYQKGSADGFGTAHYTVRSIDGPYVDGVSITYGTPRKHIWTYAIGFSEKHDGLPKYPINCPCSKFPGRLPPSFVHDNYYCESGSLNAVHKPLYGTYYTSDPVWDGKDCSIENSCCSEPNLPWFYRQIPLTANKDIETRICRDEVFANEGVLVRELQLYVQ